MNPEKSPSEINILLHETFRADEAALQHIAPRVTSAVILPNDEKARSSHEPIEGSEDIHAQVYLTARIARYMIRRASLDGGSIETVLWNAMSYPGLPVAHKLRLALSKCLSENYACLASTIDIFQEARSQIHNPMTRRQFQSVKRKEEIRFLSDN